MKKVGALFIFAILFISFLSSVIAEEMPDPTAGLKDSTGGILDEEGLHTGNINTTISPYKSKAEERIDAINNWLENNASWFKIVFGMVPELSWLFAIVLYFWLLFFVNLVLNGNIFGIIISNKNYARIAGAALFVILIVTKLIYSLGKGIYTFTDFTYNKLLPVGIVAAIVGIIIIIIVLIVLAIFAPQVLLAIKKWLDERRERKRKEEQETNQEALKKLVEGATGQKS